MNVREFSDFDNTDALYLTFINSVRNAFLSPLEVGSMDYVEMPGVQIEPMFAATPAAYGIEGRETGGEHAVLLEIEGDGEDNDHDPCPDGIDGKVGRLPAFESLERTATRQDS
jgi:hypothetical protein